MIGDGEGRLFSLEAKGPGIGAGGLDAVFGEGAGTPGVGPADAHLLVVDVEGDDVAFWDVDGVASAFEVGHEARVGPAGEEVITEGGDGETLSTCVEKGEGAQVGEVSGFLGLEVGEEEVIGGGGPASEDAAGFSVGVGFVGTVPEPRNLVVGGRDGALHAEAGEGANLPLGGDGDVNIEGAIPEDGVGDVSGRFSGGDFEVERGCRGTGTSGVNMIGADGIGASVSPGSGTCPKLVGSIIVNGGTPKIEKERT